MQSPNEDILYHLVENGYWTIDEQGRIWKKNGQRAEHRIQTGYLQARKMIQGIRLHTGAHRLIYRHFYGTIPAGLTINHKNGIKDDNRPENLELATYSENKKHAFKIGLIDQWGERNPASKLTKKQIEDIRNRYAAGGITQMQLAQEVNVAYQTISQIVRGDRRSKDPGTTANYTFRRKHNNVKRAENGQFIS